MPRETRLTTELATEHDTAQGTFVAEICQINMLYKDLSVLEECIYTQKKVENSA
jgi:hypothetical protein